MPHWSFGVRYIYQLVQHRMGHSKIFEVVFPGNPGRAYLANTNTIQENALVIAHVLGHADFSKNNLLFQRAQEQAGYHVVEQAAAHALHIENAASAHGQKRVEMVLDAALALEQHIDDNQTLSRPPYPANAAVEDPPPAEGFRKRFTSLPGEALRKVSGHEHVRAPVPLIPSMTYCGLSRTMPRRWRTGNAIFFSPCARNRSISTRYFPVRS